MSWFLRRWNSMSNGARFSIGLVYMGSVWVLLALFHAFEVPSPWPPIIAVVAADAR